MTVIAVIDTISMKLQITENNVLILDSINPSNMHMILQYSPMQN